MPKETHQYFSANAFRTALEVRLNQISKENNIDLQRLRRQVSFDRFLARIFDANPDSWLLKGGYALELRLPVARATKDVDLSLTVKFQYLQSPGKQSAFILEMLQEAASLDLQDFFIFSVGMPILDINAAPSGGTRFPVVTNLADRLFVQFHIDVALGDPVIGPVDTLTPNDWLSFADIALVPYQAISKEQHFAEKLHTYTLPRAVENSRVKDLIDMVLLIESKMNKKQLANAIKVTFDKRKTHETPIELPEPPESWMRTFEQMSHECGMTQTMTEGYLLAKQYIKQIIESA